MPDIRARIPLFFQRKKIETGEIPSIYTFDLPQTIRRSVFKLWEKYRYIDAKTICLTLRHELEMPRLVYIGRFPTDVYPFHYEIEKFFKLEKDSEKAWTVVELICQALYPNHREAVWQINRIFKTERIGYEYTPQTEMLTPLEDEQFFIECTQPFLSILNQPKFYMVLEYYVSAFEHLKQDDEDSALADIRRAIRMMLMIRLKGQDITFDPQLRFSELMDLFENHLALGKDKLRYVKLLVTEINRARRQPESHLVMSNAINTAKTNTVLRKRDDPYIRLITNQASAVLLFLSQVELLSKAKKAVA